MSTSSGAKSRAPAHQNAVAFRHNRRSRLTERIDRTVDTDGLCGACARKIEWRKKYRKYKPLTVPRRCNRCHLKRVVHAYHSLCGACADERAACAVCAATAATAAAQQQQQQQRALPDMDDARVAALVDSLSERERRTVLRAVHGGAPVSDALRKIGITLVHSHRPPQQQQQPQQPSHAPTASLREQQ